VIPKFKAYKKPEDPINDMGKSVKKVVGGLFDAIGKTPKGKFKR
jgi:hypothetical protein